MRKTLLEIVQSILASMDGEEVNSINDTVESQQIAGFIKNSYEEIIAGLNLPANNTMFNLVASNDPTQPVVMYLPDSIQDMKWIKYDKTTSLNSVGYQDVQYMEPEDFIQFMYGNYLDDQTALLNFKLPTGQFNFYYQIDKMPDYYTVLEDRILLFDSIDMDTDDTLQSHKTSCYGEKVESFRMEDSFVPVLTPKEFTLLENEAKAQAFVEQKQTQNPKAEKRARNGWIRSQRQKISIPYLNNSKTQTVVNYGRRLGKTYVRNLRNGQ